MNLIIIDGLDASGKDTQALRLHSFLRNQGKTVGVGERGMSEIKKCPEFRAFFSEPSQSAVVVNFFFD